MPGRDAQAQGQMLAECFPWYRLQNDAWQVWVLMLGRECVQHAAATLRGVEGVTLYTDANC